MAARLFPVSRIQHIWGPCIYIIQGAPGTYLVPGPRVLQPVPGVSLTAYNLGHRLGKYGVLRRTYATYLVISLSDGQSTRAG
jgi:hypothetical protein